MMIDRPVPAASGTVPSSLTFLVVEDHAFQRSMLIKMLSEIGASEIHEAAEGHSAIEALGRMARPPDIIVTDLDMPTVDGMALIRWISMHAKGPAFIVASALPEGLLTTVEAMAAAYGIHLLGTAPKPVTRGKLEELIERYIDWRHVERVCQQPPHTAFSTEAILEGVKQDEFEPFFQPQVAISSNRFVGVEALARWRHPEHGVLSPACFVKTLEDAGKIDALMCCMLRKTARFCQSMHIASGGRCSVSVNVSAKSLANVEIGDQIREIVVQEKAEPGAIVLEVTESAATTDIGQVLENLTRLRMKGFELSIDDFGTGYASLEQLTRIPFSELKIDRQFVTPAGRSRAAYVALQSSLELAHKLGLRTVAEGVESRDNMELLRTLGCDVAQGYYVARPMPLDVCLEWIGRQASRRHLSAERGADP